MESEDEHYGSTVETDGELDSEVEDTDAEKELGVWLDQLHQIQQDNYTGSYYAHIENVDSWADMWHDSENGGTKRPQTVSLTQKVSLTPKMAMDSFRNSFLHQPDDEQDVDFDAILGELCELENQLSTQQSEITTADPQRHAKPPEKPPHPGGFHHQQHHHHPQQQQQQQQRQQPPPIQHPKDPSTIFHNIDNHFQSALTELSGIMVSAMPDGCKDSQSRMTESATGASVRGQQSQDPNMSHSAHANLTPNTDKNMNDRGAGPNQMGNGSLPNGQNGHQHYYPPQQHPPGGDVGHRRTGSGGTHHRSHSKGAIPMSLLPPHDHHYHHHRNNSECNDNDFEDATNLHEEGDTDSAFSDTMSLPSSGSHISVTTTSSGTSAGSGSGSSGSSGIAPSPTSDADGLAPRPSHRANSPEADPLAPSLDLTQPHTVPGQDAVHKIIESYRYALEKENLSPYEQATKLKAEKVRLALEKIKDSNIKKLQEAPYTGYLLGPTGNELFVRAYTNDGSSKSILVDEKMTVAQVCDILVAKNHGAPSLGWCVVEHMPELYMERMLEDHDNLVENLLMWSRDTNNKLLFVERPDKYSLFQRPEEHLLSGGAGHQRLDDLNRQHLLAEYFAENSNRVPEIEGMLYLKSEGKKAWKRYYFVLRASGLYYNPKGKSKSSRDLVCLQQFDFVDIYHGLGWKKKYKAPTEHCFALKHPQIQKKASKYIRYLCADDHRTLNQWISGIRIAKYGRQLMVNFRSCQNCIATWHTREILPNPALTGLITQSQQAQQQHMKGGGGAERQQQTPTQQRQQQHPQQHQRMPSQSREEGNVQSPARQGPPPQRQESMHRDQHAAQEARREIEQRQQEVHSPITGTLRRRGSTDKMLEDAPELLSPTMPGKMIPKLPVTTEITRQISGHTESIKNKSPQHLVRKKSNASLLDRSELPPPPPELMRPQSGSSDGATGSDFPPPPSPTNFGSPGRRHSTDHNHGRTLSEGHGMSGMHGGATAAPMKGSVTLPMHTQSPRHPQNTPVAPPKPPLLSQVSLTGASLPASPQHPSPLGHRRTGSAGASPVVSPLSKGTPTRQAPPPPPKRSQNTKLSVYKDNTPENKYFIDDLQRVLVQKQDVGPEGLPQVQPPTNIMETSLSGMPLPPPPLAGLASGNSGSDMDDDLPLPPPPAELLEGYSETQEPETPKKRPPPPPRRSFETHLSSSQSNRNS